MSAMTFFYQECPVCGRSQRIAVKYFGRAMACGNCGGEFHADASQRRDEPSEVPAPYSSLDSRSSLPRESMLLRTCEGR